MCGWVDVCMHIRDCFQYSMIHLPFLDSRYFQPLVYNKLGYIQSSETSYNHHSKKKLLLKDNICLGSFNLQKYHSLIAFKVGRKYVFFKFLMYSFFLILLERKLKVRNERKFTRYVSEKLKKNPFSSSYHALHSLNTISI